MNEQSDVCFVCACIGRLDMSLCPAPLRATLSDALNGLLIEPTFLAVCFVGNLQRGLEVYARARQCSKMDQRSSVFYYNLKMYVVCVCVPDAFLWCDNKTFKVWLLYS